MRGIESDFAGGLARGLARGWRPSRRQRLAFIRLSQVTSQLQQSMCFGHLRDDASAVSGLSVRFGLCLSGAWLLSALGINGSLGSIQWLCVCCRTSGLSPLRPWHHSRASRESLPR